MKKTGFLLLLIILLLQIGGVLLFLMLKLSIVQYEMSEMLKSSQTVFEKLILTETEYKESRIDSREICYRGEMYDVKSAIVHGDRIELTVIHDKEEKNILDKIRNFMLDAGSTENKIPVQLQQLISLTYLSQWPQYTFSLPGFHVKFFLPSTPTIDSRDLDIVSPPPEIS